MHERVECQIVNKPDYGLVIGVVFMRQSICSPQSCLQVYAPWGSNTADLQSLTEAINHTLVT